MGLGLRERIFVPFQWGWVSARADLRSGRFGTDPLVALVEELLASRNAMADGALVEELLASRVAWAGGCGRWAMARPGVAVESSQPTAPAGRATHAPRGKRPRNGARSIGSSGELAARSHHWTGIRATAAWSRCSWTSRIAGSRSQVADRSRSQQIAAVEAVGAVGARRSARAESSGSVASTSQPHTREDLARRSTQEHAGTHGQTDRSLSAPLRVELDASLRAPKWPLAWPQAGGRSMAARRVLVGLVSFLTANVALQQERGEMGREGREDKTALCLGERGPLLTTKFCQLRLLVGATDGAVNRPTTVRSDLGRIHRVVTRACWSWAMGERRIRRGAARWRCRRRWRILTQTARRCDTRSRASLSLPAARQPVAFGSPSTTRPGWADAMHRRRPALVGAIGSAGSIG